MGGRFTAKRGANWTVQRKHAPKEQRTSPDGIVHRSASQMRRWNYLNVLQRAGRIRNLRREVRYLLQRGEIVVRTKTGRIAAYTADFVYDRPPQHENEVMPQHALFDTPTGNWYEVIEEHKGFVDPLSAFRIAVFEALHGVKVYMHQEKKTKKKRRAPAVVVPS